jgi:hypothetical protein
MHNKRKHDIDKGFTRSVLIVIMVHVIKNGKYHYNKERGIYLKKVQVRHTYSCLGCYYNSIGKCASSECNKVRVRTASIFKEVKLWDSKLW